MDSGAEKKIIAMLDVLAFEVAEGHRDTVALCVEVRADVATLRSEVSAGFNRVEWRLDRLESRVENVETCMRAIADLDNRETVLDEDQTRSHKNEPLILVDSERNGSGKISTMLHQIALVDASDV